MQTLYIDIYFLINLTVDTLSIYFASLLSGVPTTRARLIISSLLGASFAVVTVLLPESSFLKLISSVLGVVIIALSATVRTSLARRLKFVFSFLIFGALIGAAVNYIFGILDVTVGEELGAVSGMTVNRKLLILALIVLFSIGVFKMIVAFFSGRVGSGSVKIKIEFLGKSILSEAFVDSGNLALDPMDMRPVMFIKEHKAREFLPENIINLKDPDLLDKAIRKRIRLIPVSTGTKTRVLTGIKVDKVFVLCKGRQEEISVTLAIDSEGGDYGGFDLLMPAAAISNEGI